MRVAVSSFVLVLGMMNSAVAQDLGNFQNLSYTGDGTTLSATQLLEASQRRAQQARFAASASAKGDAQYGVGLALPAALLAPSVGLSYNSAGGEHSWVARGWELGHGQVTVERIQRKVGAEAYGDVDQPHRVSGGGWNGILWKDATNIWRYSSSGSTEAKIEYFEDSGVPMWRLSRGGITTLLEPRNDVAAWTADSPPARWRPRSVVDALGNQIDFSWSGSRLDSIEYGGQCGSAGACVGGLVEPHLVRLTFRYINRDYDSFDFADGVMDRRSQWLDRVEVGVRQSAAQKFAVWNTYVLQATPEAESGRLLSAVHVDGLTPAGSGWAPVRRTLATMDYSEEDPNGSSTLVKGAAPRHLSYRSTVPLEINADDDPVLSITMSQTKETVPIVDRSGDGLPDFTNTYSQKDWALFSPMYTSWMLRDPADGADPNAFHYLYDFDGSSYAGNLGLSHPSTTTGLCEITTAQPYGKTARYGTSVHVDVDGDGLLDVLSSDHQPVVLDGWSGDLQYCDSNVYSGLSATTWTVTYRAGRADQFTEEYSWPPAHFPSVGSPERTLVNNGEIVDRVPLAKRALDGEVELYDMNGDGWLDVVRANSNGEIRVHLKDPSYGGRWEIGTLGRLWNPGFSVGALSERLQLHDPDDVGGFASGRVIKTMATSGLRDMNGDGLVDYVQTCHINDEYAEGDYSWCGSIQEDSSGRTGEDWLVWFNTGSGFTDQPVSWNIPLGAVPFLSVVDEGANQVQSCSISGNGPGFSPPVLEDPISGGDLIDGMPGWKDEITGEMVISTQPDGDGDGIPDDLDWNPNGGGEDFGNNGKWDLTTTDVSWQISNGPPQYDRDVPRIPDFTKPVQGGSVSGGCSSAPVFRRGQRVLSNLVDWDADGRPDFVDAEAGVWYRNLGDGFSLPRDLPSWMPFALQEFYGIQFLVQDANADPNDARPDAWGSQAHNQEMWRVQDWNNDGSLDLVVPYAGYSSHLQGQGESFPQGVTFGSYSPAGLLRKITVEAGAETTVGYTAAAYMHPAGVREGTDPRSPEIYQSMAARRNLVTQITVEDPITQQGSERQIEYRYGVCEQGQCLGFEEQVVTDTKTSRTQGSPVDTVLGSETTTGYVLTRDYQVAEQVLIRTDHGRAHLPGGSGVPDLQPTFEVSTLFSSDPYTPTPGEVPNLWVEEQVFEEWPEGGSGSREWKVKVAQNAVGLPVKVSHETVRPRQVEDDLSLITEWAANTVSGAEEPSHYVPIHQSTQSWDYDLGKAISVEEGWFAYDGQPIGSNSHQTGQLTAQRVCSGPADSGVCAKGQALDWSFERTGRGVVEHSVGMCACQTSSIRKPRTDSGPPVEVRRLVSPGCQPPDHRDLPT